MHALPSKETQVGRIRCSLHAKASWLFCDTFAQLPAQ